MTMTVFVLKTVFDHISKHLKVCQKYSAARRKFNSLLDVQKLCQTQSLVFDTCILCMKAWVLVRRGLSHMRAWIK